MALTKILLVDDDEVVRYSLGRILEETGFAVTTAANVTEALKYITSDADHPTPGTPQHKDDGMASSQPF